MSSFNYRLDLLSRNQFANKVNLFSKKKEKKRRSKLIFRVHPIPEDRTNVLGTSDEICGKLSLALETFRSRDASSRRAIKCQQRSLQARDRRKVRER